MIFFQNVWWLLVLIGVMILIHELGHYWAARFFDVRVEAFSFGFGPRLFGFRKGETDFRFSLILFGGYVKMAGEQPGESGGDDPRGFLAKPRWQRLIIAFAGPFMNMVLAVALLTGVFMFRYPKSSTIEGPVTIGHVVPDSAAAKAGLREGDRIVRLDDKQDPTWEDALLKEISSADQPVHLIVDRNGQETRATMTPVLDEKTGLGFAGWHEQSEIEISALIQGMPAEKAGLKPGDVIISVAGQPVRSVFKMHEIIGKSEGKPVEILYARDGKRDRVDITPQLSDADGKWRWMIGVHFQSRVVMTKLPLPQAFRESLRQNVKYAGLIYQMLRGIIERRMSPKSLEGPIRIAQLSGDTAREGPTAFIGFMSMVSLNLAIFNLLPIPILDGGVILLLLVEMLMRRDLSLQVKEAVFKLGFVFLMVIVAFVLYNDISKMLPG